jgi:hypothetical protein
MCSNIVFTLLARVLSKRFKRDSRNSASEEIFASLWRLSSGDSLGFYLVSI